MLEYVLHEYQPCSQNSRGKAKELDFITPREQGKYKCPGKGMSLNGFAAGSDVLYPGCGVCETTGGPSSGFARTRSRSIIATRNNIKGFSGRAKGSWGFSLTGYSSSRPESIFTERIDTSHTLLPFSESYARLRTYCFCLVKGG